MKKRKPTKATDAARLQSKAAKSPESKTNTTGFYQRAQRSAAKNASRGRTG